MSALEPDAGVTALRHPAPRDALRAVEEAVAFDDLVTLFGTCTVDYRGRAASRLESGDRHVMVKPDGTVLVHSGGGHQPVNWQPPGATHEAYLDDGDLVLRSERSSPEEQLVVRFSRLRHVAAFDVRDPAELSLSGTHDDLVERLLADPGLLEPGFQPVETERRTSAGAIDVYGEDAEGRPVVVEVKRSRVGPDAVGQLRRYVDALARELADAEDGGTRAGDGGIDGEGVRGVLVAPSVTDPALDLLDADGFAFVSLAPVPDGADE